MNTVYKIRAEVSGCNYEIRLNDIPCLWNYRGRTIDEDTPINQFIDSEQTEIIVTLFPIEGQTTFTIETRLDIKIIVERDSEQEIIYNIKKDLHDLENKSTYEERHVFQIQHNFKIYPWSDNKVILDDNNKIEKLRVFCKEIYTYFENKDIENILRITTERSTFFEERYYLERGSRQQAALRDLKKVFEDEGFQLVPFNISVFKPKIFGQNKLFTLVDSEFFPFIYYYNPEKRVLVEFPFIIGITNKDDIQIFL